MDSKRFTAQKKDLELIFEHPLLSAPSGTLIRHTVERLDSSLYTFTSYIETPKSVDETVDLAELVRVLPCKLAQFTVDIEREPIELIVSRPDEILNLSLLYDPGSYDSLFNGYCRCLENLFHFEELT